MADIRFALDASKGSRIMDEPSAVYPECGEPSKWHRGSIVRRWLSIGRALLWCPVCERIR